MPPRLAPHQVVVIPIYKDDGQKTIVMETVERISTELLGHDIRIHTDDREGFTPGHKFNHWELRGVPLRMEIGPKDVANQSVTLARRDIVGKEGKSIVSQDNITSIVSDLLIVIQGSLLERATKFRDSNTCEPRDYDHFKEIVADGFALAWRCGEDTCEIAIKT